MIWYGWRKEGSMSRDNAGNRHPGLRAKVIGAHGDKAIAEAAQRASAFEQQGNKEEADTWRRVQKALLIMRGPHAT